MLNINHSFNNGNLTDHQHCGLQMNTTSHRRVQESWQEVMLQPEEFAAMLYHKLFLLHPELKPLFIRNMAMQGRKLVSMLTTAVEYPNDSEKMLPPLLAASQRHIQYGVSAEDYNKVTSALIITLQEVLGDRFDDELKKDWQAACFAIEKVMTSAMKQPPEKEIT